MYFSPRTWDGILQNGMSQEKMQQIVPVMMRSCLRYKNRNHRNSYVQKKRRSELERGKRFYMLRFVKGELLIICLVPEDTYAVRCVHISCR